MVEGEGGVRGEAAWRGCVAIRHGGPAVCDEAVIAIRSDLLASRHTHTDIHIHNTHIATHTHTGTHREREREGEIAHSHLSLFDVFFPCLLQLFPTLFLQPFPLCLPPLFLLFSLASTALSSLLSFFLSFFGTKFT